MDKHPLQPENSSRGSVTLNPDVEDPAAFLRLKLLRLKEHEKLVFANPPVPSCLGILSGVAEDEA